MSSTRVMATCALCGQAVGTAASIAGERGITPRGVYQNHIRELQQKLMDDDCYLPYISREIPSITRDAVLESDMDNAEALRIGIDRPVGDTDNGATGKIGCHVTYKLPAGSKPTLARIVLDSDLNRETLPEEEYRLNRPMFHNILLKREASYTPKTILKDFTLVCRTDDGEIQIPVRDNYQRLIKLPLPDGTREVTLVAEATHGVDYVHIFAFEIQ